jgi:hypothetical protein
MFMFVCDRHIVHSHNMLRLPQMLHRGDEALRSRVEEMFRDWSVVFFAPYSGGLCFLRRVSRCFTEADKP